MLAPVRTRSTRHFWMWALLPLLLAAALTIPLLDADAFNGDEPVSLIAAGRFNSGTHTLSDIWDFMMEWDPRNAPGWPMLLAVWGRLVGWSEVAIRALALFAGILALAWIYRAGRDFFAPWAGLFAVSLLSTSVFFLVYMANARAYSLVALFATLCLWCYWRVALHPRLPGRGSKSGLLLGSIGLLYSQYFGALLLPAIVLFHLLFIPKNRRWWQAVFLFGLAGLAATVQLSLLLEGINKVVSEDLLDKALTAPEIISHLLRYMTNGLLDPSTPFALLLLISLPLVLALFAFRYLRKGNRIGAVLLLVITSLTLLALMIFINQIARVLVDNRIRYLIPLWPLTALLAGASLWRLVIRNRRLVAGLLALWLILGTHLSLATDFRFELGFFFRSDLHRIYRAIRDQVPEDDLLVVDSNVFISDKHDYYRRLIDQDFNARIVRNEDLLEKTVQYDPDYPYRWLLFRSQDDMLQKDLANTFGLIRCGPTLIEWGFTLERLARSVARCSGDSLLLQFEQGIGLIWSVITLSDNQLRFETGLRSDDDDLLARYSLAVHIIDASSEKRVAQGDVGVGPGKLAQLFSEIDISALPTGDYEVRVALYDWQTGVRLPARDLETDEVSDMHTLHRFHIG